MEAVNKTIVVLERVDVLRVLPLPFELCDLFIELIQLPLVVIISEVVFLFRHGLANKLLLLTQVVNLLRLIFGCGIRRTGHHDWE